MSALYFTICWIMFKAYRIYVEGEKFRLYETPSRSFIVLIIAAWLFLLLVKAGQLYNIIPS